MNKTIFIMICLVSNMLIAQEEYAAKWTKSVLGYGHDLPAIAEPDAEGNVYFLTRVSSGADADLDADGVDDYTPNNNTNDIVLQKFDAEGNMLWQKLIAGDGNDAPGKLKVGADGDIYMNGSFDGTLDFGTGAFSALDEKKYFMVKYDADGDLQWINVYEQAISSFEFDATGGLYLFGSTDTLRYEDVEVPAIASGVEEGDTLDLYLLKIDPSNGDALSHEMIGNNRAETAFDITFDEANNKYLIFRFNASLTLGTTSISSQGNDLAVVKYSADGTVVWAKNIVSGASGDALSINRGIKVDAAGNVYSIGRFVETANFDFGGATSVTTPTAMYGMFIHKLDAEGNFQWVKTIIRNDDDGFTNGFVIATGLDLDVDGNVYASGRFYRKVDFFGTAYEATSNDAFLLKFDPSGETLWSHVYESSSQRVINNLALGDNGLIYVGLYYTNELDADPRATEELIMPAKRSVDAGIMVLGKVTSSNLEIFRDASYTVPSGDETYLTSGTYVDTIVNAVGVDSIITISLTIEEVMPQIVGAYLVKGYDGEKIMNDTTYVLGDEVWMAIAYDETDMSVTGTPRIEITSLNKYADYQATSSDGSTLYFMYTITEEEDPQGVNAGVALNINTVIDLNGGSIQDNSNSDDAMLDFGGLLHEGYFTTNGSITSAGKGLMGNTMHVYPNPFVENISLSFEQEITHATVSLLDHLGNVVFQKEIYNAKEYSLVTDSLNSGLYLLQIKSEEGASISTKIIKE